MIIIMMILTDEKNQFLPNKISFPILGLIGSAAKWNPRGVIWEFNRSNSILPFLSGFCELFEFFCEFCVLSLV